MSLTITELLNNGLYKNYKIIDVRGEDFKGGNIPKAINLESYMYDKKIKPFVENNDNIIVHCMYSQIRGAGVVKRLTKDFPTKNIKLLEGGFNKYFNYVININKDLIENYNQEDWKLIDNTYKNIND
jgi:Cdc25 family phosphatase